MKVLTVFEASDGTIFNSKTECGEYEARQEDLKVLENEESIKRDLIILNDKEELVLFNRCGVVLNFSSIEQFDRIVNDNNLGAVYIDSNRGLTALNNQLTRVAYAKNEDPYLPYDADSFWMVTSLGFFNKISREEMFYCQAFAEYNAKEKA